MAVKDVELVIRAKDAATRVVQEIVGSYKELRQEQDAVGASAKAADGLLGRLGAQFAALDREVQGLAAFAKVAAQIDKATAAVGRLEKGVEQAGAEAARLAAETRNASASTDQLRASADKAKSAYDAQRAATEKARQESGRTSKAYLDQKTVLDQLKATWQAESTALKAAEANERKVAAAAKASADALAAQQTQLAGAKTNLEAVAAAAKEAGAALGGVDANSAAVAAASARAGGDLARVRGAISARPVLPETAPSAGPAAEATAAYRAQTQAVRDALQTWKLAQVEANRLGTEIRKTVAPTEAQRTAFVLAQAASADAKQAYLTQARSMSDLKGVTQGSFAAFIQQAEAIRTDTAALGGMKSQLPPIAEAQRRVGQVVDQTTAAMKRQGSSAKGATLFGLKPYELQNLAYQVNDVITQLASGTSITQTFAQQGGQIAQIFLNKGGGGLFKTIAAGAGAFGAQAAAAVPEVAALIAAGLTLLQVLKNNADLATSQREFGALQAASADGARYQSKALAEAAHDLDVYGTSLKNARQEVRIFMQQGIDPSQIERFGVAAQNMADVFGVQVPDAAKQAAEAFTGGYEAVKKLDDATNFLTAAEREHIRALFDSGDASRARAEAFDIFARKMDEGAAKARGPWSDAIRHLTAAWDNFLRFLQNAPIIRDVINLLGELAKEVERLTALLPGAKAAATNSGKITREESRLKDLQQERQYALQNEVTPNGGLRLTGRGYQPYRLRGTPGRTTAQIDADIKATQGRLQQLRGELGGAMDDASQRAQKAGADVLHTLRDEYDSLKQVNDARRIQIAGEKAARQAAEAGADAGSVAKAKALGEQIEKRKVDQENERRAASAGRRAQAAENQREALARQLDNDLSQIESKVERNQIVSLDERLKGIDDGYKKIATEVARYKKMGGTDIGGLSIEQYQARLEANKDLLKQQETMKFYSESLAALEKQRDDRLKSIADQVAAGGLGANEAYKQAEQVNGELAPQIAQMADDAVRFAEGVKGAKPDPKLLAFIEEMRRAGGLAKSGGENSPLGKTGKALLGDQEADLNAVIARRTALIEAANRQFDAGLIGEDARLAKIKDAYETTTPKILEQTEAMRQQVEELYKTGAIGVEVYELWKAKLAEVNAATVDLSSQVLTTAQANDLFISSLNSGFTTFAQRLAETGKFFVSLRDTALNMTADFLSSLAKIIFQAAALRAIMSTSLGKWLSGKVNGLFDGKSLLGAAGALSAAGLVLKNSARDLLASAAALAAAGATSSAASSASALASLAGLYHEGGVVGRGGGLRLAHPNVFAGALRYHVGGIAGLQPGEVPAILKQGEEVLTSSDPRHIFNGGKGSARDTARQIVLKITNAIDSGELYAQGLATQTGEQAFMNHVRANSAAIKVALG